jgi:hypothetical protein
MKDSKALLWLPRAICSNDESEKRDGKGEHREWDLLHEGQRHMSCREKKCAVANLGQSTGDPLHELEGQ